MAPETYLTVREAARQLLVHPTTIRRWIDQGRLPAFRLGEKRIGIKSSDLARLVVPRSGRPGEPKDQARLEQADTRLTSEEQRRGFQAIAQLRRLRDELCAKYGSFTPESWELINESREERTQQLMDPTHR